MSRVGIFVMIAVLMAACKKKPLPDLPEDNAPYYSISGLMDDDSVNLYVGQEGITFAQGPTEVNGVQAYFGQISSPAEDLTIKMTIVRPERPLGSDGIQAISPSSIGFLVHESGCRDFSFAPYQGQSNYLLIKDVNGNFVPAESVNFEEYGNYEVTMKFTDVGQNSFVVPLNYGFETYQHNPKFVVYPEADTVSFAATVQDGSHQWLVDGSLMSTNHSFSSTTLSAGIHKVEHILTDEYGNEASYITLIRITDFVLDWQMHIGSCGGQNPSNYGKVIVSVEKDGELYTSEFVDENVNAVFSASNVEYVSTGNSGAADRAVFDFFFNAQLQNDTQTESLSLSSMTGTFNVGL